MIFVNCILTNGNILNKLKDYQLYIQPKFDITLK